MDDMIEAGTKASKRPSRKRPRADAVRNRELVIEAARTVFNAGGAGASLEAVAREAGVGIGTLYRHFPTREALFGAVYRREVEKLACLADDLSTDAAPAAALRQWMHGMVEFVATKKGMSAALAVAAQASPELMAFSFEHLNRAAGELLRRGVDSGGVRADIGPDDLIRALVGLCYTHDGPGWQDSVHRLVDVLADGLAHSAPGAETSPLVDQRPIS